MATHDDTCEMCCTRITYKDLEGAARAARGMRKVVFVAAVVIDVYDLSKAIYTDCTITEKKRPGKNTLRATASVLAARTGSAFGSIVGARTGAYFGEVGALPGSIIGGILGSFAGSFLAKKVVDKFV